MVDIENLKFLAINTLLLIILLIALTFVFNMLYQEKFKDYYVQGEINGKAKGYQYGYENGAFEQKKIDDKRLYQNYVFCEVKNETE